MAMREPVIHSTFIAKWEAERGKSIDAYGPAVNNKESLSQIK